MRRIKATYDWIDEGRGYRKRVLADGKALGQTGCLAQLVSVAPGDTVAPHHHRAQTEFYYILKGEAILIVNGKRNKTLPGDAFVCEPGDVHGITNGSKSGEFLFIVFKTNFKKGDIYWE